MRLLLIIAASMVLALVMAMGLERAGVVHFGAPVKGHVKDVDVPVPGEDKGKKPPEAPLTRAVKARGAVKDETSGGNNTLAPPGTVVSEQGQLPRMEKGAGAVKQALGFLRGDRCADPSAIEGALRKFLTDRGVGEKETSTIVKMAFWKGFVSLQDPGTIPPSSIEQAFAMEEELKRAGFRCMGVPLMEPEIEAARARLREVLRPGEGTGAEDGS